MTSVGALNRLHRVEAVLVVQKMSAQTALARLRADKQAAEDAIEALLSPTRGSEDMPWLMLDAVVKRTAALRAHVMTLSRDIAVAEQHVQRCDGRLVTWSEKCRNHAIAASQAADRDMILQWVVSRSSAVSLE